jgi:hypothetical protein
MQNQWHELEGSQLEWVPKERFLSIIRSIAIQILVRKESDARDTVSLPSDVVEKLRLAPVNPGSRPT